MSVNSMENNENVESPPPNNDFQQQQQQYMFQQYQQQQILMDKKMKSQYEKRIVAQYIQIYHEAQQCFAELKHVSPYSDVLKPFQKAFDKFSQLWAFQAQNREILCKEKRYGLKRTEIGDIAAKIGQIYYFFYLRTSNLGYLRKSFSFYEVIRNRQYYRKILEERNEQLFIKKLRYTARFIVVCLLLNENELVKTLLEEFRNDISTHERIFCPQIPVINPNPASPTSNPSSSQTIDDAIQNNLFNLARYSSEINKNTEKIDKTQEKNENLVNNLLSATDSEYSSYEWKFVCNQLIEFVNFELKFFISSSSVFLNTPSSVQNPVSGRNRSPSFTPSFLNSISPQTQPNNIESSSNLHLVFDNDNLVSNFNVQSSHTGASLVQKKRKSFSQIPQKMKTPILYRDKKDEIPEIVFKIFKDENHEKKQEISKFDFRMEIESAFLIENRHSILKFSEITLNLFRIMQSLEFGKNSEQKKNPKKYLLTKKQAPEIILALSNSLSKKPWKYEKIEKLAKELQSNEDFMNYNNYMQNSAKRLEKSEETLEKEKKKNKEAEIFFKSLPPFYSCLIYVSGNCSNPKISENSSKLLLAKHNSPIVESTNLSPETQIKAIQKSNSKFLTFLDLVPFISRRPTFLILDIVEDEGGGSSFFNPEENEIHKSMITMISNNFQDFKQLGGGMVVLMSAKKRVFFNEIFNYNKKRREKKENHLNANLNLNINLNDSNSTSFDFRKEGSILTHFLSNVFTSLLEVFGVSSISRKNYDELETRLKGSFNKIAQFFISSSSEKEKKNDIPFEFKAFFLNHFTAKFMFRYFLCYFVLKNLFFERYEFFGIGTNQEFLNENEKNSEIEMYLPKIYPKLESNVLQEIEKIVLENDFIGFLKEIAKNLI